MNTKFYHYSQNNSGGFFDEDETRGICNDVIIEAKNAQEANLIAHSIGIYFNGCENGCDCPCCGDRWSEVGEWQGEDYPHIFSTKLEDCTKGWSRYYCFVHYLNGQIKKVVFND